MYSVISVYTVMSVFLEKLLFRGLSQPLDVFCKKGVLENFEKTPVSESLF